jgi:hypothetical protein
MGSVNVLSIVNKTDTAIFVQFWALSDVSFGKARYDFPRGATNVMPSLGQTVEIEPDRRYEFEFYADEQGLNGQMYLKCSVERDSISNDNVKFDFDRDGHCSVSSEHERGSWPHPYRFVEGGKYPDSLWFGNNYYQTWTIFGASDMGAGFDSRTPKDRIGNTFARLFVAKPVPFKKFTGQGLAIYKRISLIVTDDESDDARSHYRSILDNDWGVHANTVRIVKDRGALPAERGRDGNDWTFQSVCDQLTAEFEEVHDVKTYLGLVRRMTDRIRSDSHDLAGQVVATLNLADDVELARDGHTTEWHAKQITVAVLWGLSAALGKKKGALFAMGASLVGSYWEPVESGTPVTSISVADYVSTLSAQDSSHAELFEMIDSRVFTDAKLLGVLSSEVRDRVDFGLSDEEKFVEMVDRDLLRYFYRLLMPLRYTVFQYEIFADIDFLTDGDEARGNARESQALEESKLSNARYSMGPPLMRLVHRAEGHRIAPTEVTDAIIRQGVEKKEMMKFSDRVYFPGAPTGWT